MDPTTLFTFIFHAPPGIHRVELLGSWDNFSKPYSMYHDRRRGQGFWTGCFTFQDIVFDGDRNQWSRPRTGGLKQGGTYWYYFRLDDITETYNDREIFTSNCPLLPGQAVNVLDVPWEEEEPPTSRRSASVDMSNAIERSTSTHTLNPQDKFAALAPPPVSRVHGRCVSDLALSGRLENAVHTIRVSDGSLSPERPISPPPLSPVVDDGKRSDSIAARWFKFMRPSSRRRRRSHGRAQSIGSYVSPSLTRCSSAKPESAQSSIIDIEPDRSFKANTEEPAPAMIPEFRAASAPGPDTLERMHRAAFDSNFDQDAAATQSSACRMCGSDRYCLDYWGEIIQRQYPHTASGTLGNGNIIQHLRYPDLSAHQADSVPEHQFCQRSCTPPALPTRQTFPPSPQFMDQDVPTSDVKSPSFTTAVSSCHPEEPTSQQHRQRLSTTQETPDDFNALNEASQRHISDLQPPRPCPSITEAESTDISHLFDSPRSKASHGSTISSRDNSPSAHGSRQPYVCASSFACYALPQVAEASMHSLGKNSSHSCNAIENRPYGDLRLSQHAPPQSASLNPSMNVAPVLPSMLLEDGDHLAAIPFATEGLSFSDAVFGELSFLQSPA